jgi:hypothetical protein
MNSTDVQKSTQEEAVNTNLKNKQKIKAGNLFLFKFIEKINRCNISPPLPKEKGFIALIR